MTDRSISNLPQAATDQPGSAPIAARSMLGMEHTWDAGSIYVGYGFSRLGDELSLYYTAHRWTHRPANRASTKDNNSVISRAVYRLDGFVSVEAPSGDGEWVTPPLLFQGDRLEVNFDGSAGGWLRVELQDGRGATLRGFSLSDADAVLGNSTAETVNWRGRHDLASLVGNPVKLRFVIHDAKLYAFQFRPGPAQ